MPSSASFLAQLTGRKPGVIPPPPVPETMARQPFFENFWSLERRKNPAQAALLVGSFIAVTAAMDAIVFMPFRDVPEAQEILRLVMKFSPSLLVCVALAVLAAMGRGMPAVLKMLAVSGIAAAGLFFGSLIAFVPLFGLLLLPGKADGQEAADDFMSAMPPAESDFISVADLAEASRREMETAREPAADEDMPDEFNDPLAAYIRKPK